MPLTEPLKAAGIHALGRGRVRAVIGIECGTRAAIHRVRGDQVMLVSARRRDLPITTAHACDPEAQRWLGWPPHEVMSSKQIARARARRPGGEQLPWQRPPFQLTVHVGEEVVGAVMFYPVGGRWHLGFYLAPERRGQGHGRRALLAGTELMHRHLGVEEVIAGSHPDNTASVRALRAAGFVDEPGPEEHRLPSGEVIPTLWLAHRAPATRRCRWLDLPAMPS